MIIFKEFKEAVDSVSKINDFNDEFYNLHKIDISETDAIQEGWRLFDIFIESHFTDEGSDLIFWWMYEDVPKIIYQDTIFGKVETNIEDIEDLWKYLISDKEVYFK